jgi:chromodomain-helicase-DNA-binding protein 1
MKKDRSGDKQNVRREDKGADRRDDERRDERRDDKRREERRDDRKERRDGRMDERPLDRRDVALDWRRDSRDGRDGRDGREVRERVDDRDNFDGQRESRLVARGSDVGQAGEGNLRRDKRDRPNDNRDSQAYYSQTARFRDL